MGSNKRSEYTNLTDEKLVSLSQNGDEYAFNILAGRYLNARAHKASSYLDSDDFVQESMFGFLNAVRTFDIARGVPFKAFAGVCMRNSINSAAVNLPDDIPVENTSDTITEITVGDDPLSHIITSEQLAEVISACDVTLSEVEKIVVFSRAGGMSYNEIGVKLGMSAKAVDNAVQRARRKLKKVITPRG